MGFSGLVSDEALPAIKRGENQNELQFKCHKFIENPNVNRNLQTDKNFFKMSQNGKSIPMPPKPESHLLTTSPDLLLLKNVPLNLNLVIGPDPGALQQHQRDRLLDLLHADRLTDKDYLRRHPEINALVNLIFRSLMDARPDDIFEHLDQYFSQPQIDLELAVQKELDQLRLARDTEPAESAGGNEEQETDDELRNEEVLEEEQENEESLSRCWGSLNFSEHPSVDQLSFPRDKEPEGSDIRKEEEPEENDIRKEEEPDVQEQEKGSMLSNTGDETLGQQIEFKND